ncbi:hypothetical protein D3C78_816030 [compost metagenome]
MQAAEILRQLTEAVAGQVEDFQAVGQVEDFLGELLKPALQIEAGNACQSAGLEIVEGMHGVDTGPVKKTRRP